MLSFKCIVYVSYTLLFAIVCNHISKYHHDVTTECGSIHKHKIIIISVNSTNSKTAKYWSFMTKTSHFSGFIHFLSYSMCLDGTPKPGAGVWTHSR